MIMQVSSIRQICLYWLPPLLFTAGIITLSGDLGSGGHTRRWLQCLFACLPFLEAGEVETVHVILRKAGHVTAYGFLYWLWFRAFAPRFSSRLRLAVFWSLGLCLLTASTDEIHQSVVGTRTGSILDVALDFGAAILTALALSFKRI
ncbi:MAG: VanZ family protein [Deltaproteobacteria bacterium]|nr:MAG: VanZ family protein [Deltaproteobacteria bacterium]